MKKQRHVESESAPRSRSNSHGSPALFGPLTRHRALSATGTLLLAVLLGVLLMLSPSPAQVQASSDCQRPAGDDYDADDDGLIEVSCLAQLNAIRWDLNGDAKPDVLKANEYNSAFPGILGYWVHGQEGPGCVNDRCRGYELVVDLDFDTNGSGRADAGDEYWNEGLGWQPIGHAAESAFNTVFEGNGHVISSLYVNRKHGRLGLFMTIGGSGVVRNVGLQDVDVSGMGHNVSGLAAINHGSIANSRVTGSVEGGNNVGLLTGENHRGSILNSSAVGTVSGLSNVGGLVGDNSWHGQIERSRAVGTVSGRNAVGGLVGAQGHYSVIRFGQSTASVTGTRNGGSAVGGLIGENRGDIMVSYATGQASGKANDTGGLVGRNDDHGKILASYATGPVSSSGRNIGGLVGSNNGQIRASYATGPVSGDSSLGGLAGREKERSSQRWVTDSYWDTTTSGATTSPAGTGKSTAELQTPTGYTGIYANWNLDVDRDGNPDNPWDFGTSNDYPVLKSGLLEASPAGAAHPFVPLATGVNFTASADLTTDDADDLSLQTLAVPDGFTMSPSFQSSVYEYTLAAPAAMEHLAFTGSFTSLADRSQRTAFGLVALGTPDELDSAIDNRSGRPAETVFAVDSDGATRVRVIAMPAPGSTTTVEIRVYKKLTGRVDEWPLQASENSVVKTYTLTVEREALGEDNATLKDLSISAGTLYFDPYTTAYEFEVPFTLASVIITPTVLHSGATVTVNGADPATPVELDHGENTIQVVVTAADGLTTQTYVITMTRPWSENVYFMARMERGYPNSPTTNDDVEGTTLVLPEGYTVEPEFQSDTYSYTLTVPAGARQLPVAGGFTAKYDYPRENGFGLIMARTMSELEQGIDKLVATSQRFRKTVVTALDPPGSTTTIEIGVYKKLPGRESSLPTQSARNSVKKVYTLEVIRDLPANDDATLYDLTVSEGWLDFDPDTTSYTVHVTRDVESVVLTPSATHPHATVTVNGSDPTTAVSLDKGENVIPVVVTAPDGVTTQTYQVTVVRGGTRDYSALIAQMYQWRNDPQWSSYKSHTDRWDRTLLAFGETVADTTLTPMTAAEAQALADRGSAWARWIEVAAALRDLESTAQQRQHQWQQQQYQYQQQQQATSTDDRIPRDPGEHENRAPTVSTTLPDVSGLEAGATQEVSLSGTFSDADGDALTITATSSDDSVATVSVASDGSTLTVTGVSEGTATITVTAEDTGGSSVTDAFDVSVAPESPGEYAALIAQMYQWRNDPQYVSDKSHTDRWDRTLLAFGETVADTTLTAMTAAEAQGYADRGWTRWVEVAEALQELESGNQQPTPNRAPTVSAALGDVTIVSESGTKQVSLSGVFDDADGDALTITATSSNGSVATVSAASDGSSLTVTARSRGTATITVTADDGSGGTVEDTFTVRVKAAPTVASALSDVSGLEAGATREVSLSGTFSDADGDALTITATSSDDSVATVSVATDGSTLTVTGVSEGTATITVTARDPDGNRASDSFDVSVTRAPDPTPTPTPDPTPTPTPGPESSTLSGAAARYDANGDGAIDLSEYSQAIKDYFAEVITYAEMIEVVRAYLGSG